MKGEECVHGGKERPKEWAFTANDDIWLREQGTAAKSVCCGNELLRGSCAVSGWDSESNEGISMISNTDMCENEVK